MATLTNSRRQFGLVAILAFMSWLGMMIHNAIELPQLTLLNPEVSLPTLVYIGLVSGWRLLLHKRLWVMALFMWALLHLVGGGLITVIPFPFLPFYPEQSLQHYFAHVVYGGMQLPLLIWTFKMIRRS